MVEETVKAVRFQQLARQVFGAEHVVLNGFRRAYFHQRRTTTENGHIYEYTTSYMRADRVKLDVRFQKGSTSFMRTVD